MYLTQMSVRVATFPTGCNAAAGLCFYDAPLSQECGFCLFLGWVQQSRHSVRTSRARNRTQELDLKKRQGSTSFSRAIAATTAAAAHLVPAKGSANHHPQ